MYDGVLMAAGGFTPASAAIALQVCSIKTVMFVCQRMSACVARFHTCVTLP
jgi:hypothetical protein